MGANNWRVCPKCKQDAAVEKERKAAVVGEAYGQVSPEVYLEMFQKAAAPAVLRETLREDYEIFTTEDGRFYVSYRASCDECGFDHRFKAEENVL